MKKITYILSIFLIFISNPIAAKEHAEPIKKLLTDYISAINSLGKTGEKEDVLSLFSKDYTGNTTYVRLSGSIIKNSYNKNDISIQLDDIVADNYRFNLSLDKIAHTIQKEKAGTISALVSFESSIDNKIAEKGTMIINIVGASGRDGIWRIVQNNMVRVSEEKEIGDCVCYVYGKGSTKFVTETYFPAGVEYSHKLESFNITTKGDIRTIKTNDKEFSWNVPSKELSSKGVVIGKASMVKEAIQLAIKDMHKDYCVNVSFN
ncbi:hypothetical protein GCM10022393_37110 [Aquimarina addita]|uniref:Curli production assembly/transport component CsgG n=1 Tax=Aquimarina addita TaxID=870485 RepID=A0ABP6UT50_9FLAO